jgi:type IV secretion system protein VirD4
LTHLNNISRFEDASADRAQHELAKPPRPDVFTVVRIILILTSVIALCVAALLASITPGMWLVILGVAAWMVKKKVRRSIAHGSARWATPDDVRHLLKGRGLILGRIDGPMSRWSGLRALFNPRLPPRESCQRFLMAFQSRARKPVVRLTTAVHTAVFAPTGAGKGVSCVIPLLLTDCSESTIVVDYKGELAKLTAHARRRMGHRVVLLDPYRNATGEPDTLNPIEHIEKDSPTALDDCCDVANAAVTRTGQEREPHWADSAELWISAMIALIVAIARGEDKSLQSVRTLLTDPVQMRMAITMMCESKEMDGMLARLGHQLTHFQDKELSSVLTTVSRFMRFLDTAAIAESTKRSSFDPADLLKGKMTVYLVLPPDRARAQAALLRMWIGCLLRAVVKGGLQDTTKVHFILDEAASLGHMDALDDAVDKLRGYGVRLTFFYQSLGQLRKCFPDGQDQTLLSNTTQVFFGVNDQQTAEYVSARLGEETIVTESGGTSEGTSTQCSRQGDSTSYSSNSNHNWQYMGRKLLKPDEVIALPERTAITFTPGVPPIATRLVRYYEKDFKHLDGMSPVEAGLRVAGLFLAVLAAAVAVTAAMLNHTPQ